MATDIFVADLASTTGSTAKTRGFERDLAALEDKVGLKGS